MQWLLAASFPWPLPQSADSADALCSNRTRIDLHLCSPQEIETYYKVPPSRGSWVLDPARSEMGAQHVAISLSFARASTAPAALFQLPTLLACLLACAPPCQPACHLRFFLVPSHGLSSSCY